MNELTWVFYKVIGGESFYVARDSETFDEVTLIEEVMIPTERGPQKILMPNQAFKVGTKIAINPKNLIYSGTVNNDQLLNKLNEILDKIKADESGIILPPKGGLRLV